MANRWAQAQPYATSAIPYIGENGNWWVNREDTGVKAQGPQGEKGLRGEAGIGAPGPALQYEDLTDEQKEELVGHLTPEMQAIKDSAITETNTLIDTAKADMEQIKADTVQVAADTATNTTAAIVDAAIADAKADIDAAVSDAKTTIDAATANAEQSKIDAQEAANTATTQAGNASASANAAASSAENASAYANEAYDSANDSAAEATKSAASAIQAADYASKAAASAEQAAASIPEDYTELQNQIAAMEEASLNANILAITNSRTINNTTTGAMHIAKIYGKSSQYYTPTPTAPCVIKASGASGKIVILTYFLKDGVETVGGPEVEITTPTGLFGIPVDSDGNYTDENGQQWICDEITNVNAFFDTAGYLIKRTAIAVFDGSDDEDWSMSSTNGNQFVISIVDNVAKNVVCTHFANSKVASLADVADLTCAVDPNTVTAINFRYDAITSVADWKTFLSANPMHVVYAISEPTETVLDGDQFVYTWGLMGYDGTTYVHMNNDETTEVEPDVYIEYGTCKAGVCLLNTAFKATVAFRQSDVNDFSINTLWTSLSKTNASVADLTASCGHIVTGTLTTGDTSLTIEDTSIVADSSMFDIYTNVYGVSPTEVSVVDGSITLTFDTQESDLGVKVRVM